MNPACRVEFKPMNKPKSPWKPYKAKIKKGTKATGIVLKNGLFQFKVAKPKNLFFRGPAKCLIGGKGIPRVKAPAPPTPDSSFPVENQAASDPAPLVETPPTETIDDALGGTEAPPAETEASPAEVVQVEAAPSPVRVREARSYLSLQAMYWMESFSLEGDSINPEPLTGTQYGGGIGYGWESKGASFTWGLDAHVFGALSSLKNSVATPETVFNGSGLVGGLMLRPMALYSFGKWGVGLTLPLMGRYGIYQAVSEGTVTKPFKFVPMAGTSLRYLSGDTAYALNVNLVNFSKIFVGLQLDF